MLGWTVYHCCRDSLPLTPSPLAKMLGEKETERQRDRASTDEDSRPKKRRWPVCLGVVSWTCLGGVSEGTDARGRVGSGRKRRRSSAGPGQCEAEEEAKEGLYHCTAALQFPSEMDSTAEWRCGGRPVSVRAGRSTARGTARRER